MAFLLAHKTAAIVHLKVAFFRWPGDLTSKEDLAEQFLVDLETYTAPGSAVQVNRADEWLETYHNAYMI